ncbi:NUDIX hydrolase [Pseudanabaena sp. FACHB-2040]|uniref:NUDIX hydrolase n=1 Tax=Pseudanabaena sp. FACHB-2040 TaxID=2692859 RepID=UPI001684CCC2|nr:NUDIX hydrolase [Pseudanabaena sp. FACHB-2040]MBD2258693.1 NUDIX hydrolase [Pseudanabaena sp. FACHB-2040]
MSHQWLKWAQQLQAISQNGLTYQNHPYDVERYEQLQQIAAEIMATYTDLDMAAILDLFQREKWHATPKVDVRGAVFRDGQILLVQQRTDGFWTLPGGWADVGESPSQAVVREILEESGFETKAVKVAAVYDRDHPRHGHLPEPYHVYKLIFLCELLSGAPTESYEIQQIGFFREDEIPDLSLYRVVPSQISRLFDYYRDPNLPTDFD